MFGKQRAAQRFASLEHAGSLRNRIRQLWHESQDAAILHYLYLGARMQIVFLAQFRRDDRPNPFQKQ